ncbi:hypothetical protein GGTG_08656 [Gaeumannomyces tritici R3-111a-1]|uniref:Uncharacterized protein n=1 Tax=Gaeumannomyces tritici (strain R3-111a-1) TaxID=644352 RepID=J3P567_GAET3|nr:hypothetical protein GGTG_08656 [Gaeumannomyces tritici R3-111a-1]EJT74818.1 hypothetical protein GGTG_08656 [Gaeumannomyces tritici R3-111a-1]
MSRLHQSTQTQHPGQGLPGLSKKPNIYIALNPPEVPIWPGQPVPLTDAEASVLASSAAWFVEAVMLLRRASVISHCRSAQSREQIPEKWVTE